MDYSERVKEQRKDTMLTIGTGIFTWDSLERRSRRYGYFVLNRQNYDCNESAPAIVNQAWLNEHEGQRVRLMATVVAARPSGHAGDAFLGLLPAQPKEGEKLLIGVGILRGTYCSWSDMPQIGLEPTEEPRAELWLDPRILYRLHDQTIVLAAESTADHDHPSPDLTFKESGAISNGDGTFQASGSGYVNGVRILPSIESIPDMHGAFTIAPQDDPGEGMYLEASPAE
jgi:hypothetical protein